MRDYIERFSEPKMEYYRKTYLYSRRWYGENLNNKDVIVYMEQGIGDQIMFLRFLRFLKEQTPKSITLHAPMEMERIVKHLGYGFLEKGGDVLPYNDYHICSLSLPFLLHKPIPLEPYIILTEKTEIPKGINVGIAWEGNPDHPRNVQRSCPLKFFKPLVDKGVNLFHIQPSINNWDLVKGAEDFPLNGVTITDWYDTAKLINSLDYVVSVDTGAVHLAGAMGKRTYVLLGPDEPDARWDGLWYPTTRLIKGDWEKCFETLLTKISD
jgi:hypothetical protein